jgi:hypothetical protein
MFFLLTNKFAIGEERGMNDSWLKSGKSSANIESHN